MVVWWIGHHPPLYPVSICDQMVRAKMFVIKVIALLIPLHL
jgi:hypothetical protein